MCTVEQLSAMSGRDVPLDQNNVTLDWHSCHYTRSLFSWTPFKAKIIKVPDRFVCLSPLWHNMLPS